MAIILSPIASRISGSIGDVTYQANPYHPIVARSRPSPANLPSARRTSYLAARTWAWQQWLATTEANRQAWSDYAATLSISSNGSSHAPTGHRSFMAALTFRRFLKTHIGDPSPVTTTAPTIPGRITLRILGPLPPPSGVGWSWILYNDNPSRILVLRATAPIQPITRTRWHGPYSRSTYYSNIPAGGSVRYDTTTGILNDTYFQRFRAVSVEAPHRLSLMLYLRLVCVPA